MRRAFLTTLAVAFVFLFLTAERSLAQYRFDLWNTDNGLPQSSVKAIQQTRDGYLWLTTSDGLVRFDGIHFTIFNKGNTKGIRSNRFNTLYEQRDGSLWIGTDDGGVTRYRDHRFVSYSTPEGLLSSWVWAIREDSAGRPLVLTRLGITQWSEEKFIPWTPADRTLDRYHEWWHRFGGVSFYDASGLHLFDGSRFQTFTTADGLSSLNFVWLSEDQDGASWVATKEGLLYRFKGGGFSTYELGKLRDQKITAVHQDRRHRIWLSTRGGDLNRFQDGIWTAYQTGFPKEGFAAIYEDREGDIWLGAVDGLRRLRDQIITTYSQAEGLAGNLAYPIYQDHEGSVWIGTWRGGLTKYKDGVFKSYTTKDGLAGDLVNTLWEDRDGYLWIGTQDHGLDRFKDGKFRNYTTADGLADQGITSLYEDREGVMWVGALSGLSKYQNGKFVSYSSKDGLATGAVQVIHEDREGKLWLGNLGGLSCFSKGKFTTYTERDGLSSNHIRSILEDNDGTLWIGTYDAGLNRLKNGKFTSCTTNNGLFNNGVFQILDDGRGNFWMSSNLGIYRVSRNELNDFSDGKITAVNSIPYGKKDGMLDGECNGGRQPAGFKTRDGKLWFPTQKGVAVIDPSLVEIATQPPPVAIEDFILDNRSIDFGGTIRIEPGQEDFEVHYTALSFIVPEQTKFKYQLVGLDNGWVDAGTRRVAYYHHIPPGNYTFKVIAANGDGVWNMTGAAVTIIVRPPFWRTWWFLCCVVAVVLALAILAYRRRVSRLKRTHAEQQAFSHQLINSQEQERKRIAAELHDSLGQNLLIIKNRALLGLSTPDNHQRAMDELEVISGTASQAIGEVREIAHNLRPYQLDRLGLTKALAAMIRKTAGSSNIEFSTTLDKIDDLFSKESEINLYRIVQESVNNILKHSAATRAGLTIRKESRGVEVIIEDNGKGMAAIENGEAAGMGLSTIAERVKILGGQQSIRSAPGQGTVITLKIGLQNGSREN
jgi:signal transduction histidine kinase/streptogramin lyase